MEKFRDNRIQIFFLICYDLKKYEKLKLYNNANEINGQIIVGILFNKYSCEILV